MKRPLKPFIIGAGGVASYLLPALLRTFNVQGGVLMDKDILEKRNLDRQLFQSDLVGRNKAVALLATLCEEKFPPHWPIIPVERWFSAEQSVDGFDVVICVADNHVARAAALEAGDRAQVPVIIGGNEYFDSDAYYYSPIWEDDPKLDPRKRWPAILTDRSNNPASCQGEAQEASPQLALANQRCACFIAHLLWAWFVEAPEMAFEDQGHLPVSLFASLNQYEVNLLKDLTQ